MSALSDDDPSSPGLGERVAEELEAARARTLGLLEPLAPASLLAQHSPLMSPLVWDLAHIGNYEDQWLLRALDAAGPGADYDDLYDAFRHPRRTRAALDLLDPDAARAYDAEVRARVLDLLASVRFEDRREHPLLAGGLVYGMVVQHEHQHDETMLAALQLLPAERAYRPIHPPAPAQHPDGPEPPGEVFVAGGPFTMGTDREPWAYDNERPAHTVEVAPFWIDATPVTNEAYARFVADGGYDDARWWRPEGWSWRQAEDARHPQFWSSDGAGGWVRDRFGHVEALPPDQPVQHVCWYEADAYARWAGRRLPTEAEWEKAAAWDPRTGRSGRFPWGDEPPTAERANLGQRHYGPGAVSAHPGGVSPCGAWAMVGDVWEWTASDFGPHPRFVAHPYREYSEVFFGPEYKVLRGGSWATHPSAVRTTFRNWDYPIRRQIFAGFRCARDV